MLIELLLEKDKNHWLKLYMPMISTYQFLSNFVINVMTNNIARKFTIIKSPSQILI